MSDSVASLGGLRLFDRSGTVTTGGVAQQLSPAYPARRGFWVQNISGSDLWVNGMGTASAAQPSIRIPPGALYESMPIGVPTGAISIFGASTGQAFVARDFGG